MTQQGPMFVMFEEMPDSTVLTVDSNGKISQNSIANGILTSIWSYETNLTTTCAKLDSGNQLIAVGYDSGHLSFNVVSKEVLYYNNLSSTPDGIDWDSEGDIWLSYQTGQRKAIEYSSTGLTGYKSGVVASGFFASMMLTDDTMAFAAMDTNVHIYDKNSNLVRKLTQPTAYLSTIFQDSNDNLLVGASNGKMYIYNTTSWAQPSLVDLGVNEVISYIDEIQDDYIVGTEQSSVFLVDKDQFTIDQSWSVDGEVKGSYHYSSGQISIMSKFSNQHKLYYLDIDSDSDGVGDSLDVYPADPTQTSDSDGDGYGDNPSGNNGDAFPNDGTQSSDSDGDGYGDNPTGSFPDLFPLNADQWNDTDGDGYGDNSNGQDGDKYPDDISQWNDTDGDGYGDNINGNNPDGCPNEPGYSTIDRYGCKDSDLDLYSDPDSSWSVLDGADALPNEKTQWNDADGDGFGENPSPAVTPDNCPLISGNSTQEIRTDGTITQRYGCLDTDGDSFDDSSDEFPNNPSEWYDGDEDGVGSNSDFDDTTPKIKTQLDYCFVSGDQSNICMEVSDLDYQEYLSRDKSAGETDLSYSVWLASKDSNLQDDDSSLTSAIKQVVIIGGGVFVAATILILVASLVLKKRKINDLVKRYGVPFKPKDTTATQEALEGTAGLSASGGIDSDDSWDEDVKEMDFSESNEEEVEEEVNTVSAEELYDAETDISDLAGIEISPEATSEEEVSAMLQDEETEIDDEKPSEVPPLPATGLPEGWTMEQWEWYGAEWLSKQNDQ